MLAFLQKWTCEGTLRQVFIRLMPPGVVKQFCRFGIWSNKQCMTPVYALWSPLCYTLYKLTINVPVVYMGRYEGVLRGDYP
jgi:hypothetical protein